MSRLHRVFVYGTLKKGEPNHDCFEKGQQGSYRFICEATTVEKYPLIIATEFNIPFLLYSPGTGKNVRGELYEVDDTILSKLDELEDHPNFYIREENEVTVTIKNETKTIMAWIYFIKNFQLALLKRMFYENYSNEGSHGLKYVARYLRSTNENYKIGILTNLKHSSENATLEDLNGRQ